MVVLTSLVNKYKHCTNISGPMKCMIDIKQHQHNYNKKLHIFTHCKKQHLEPKNLQSAEGIFCALNSCHAPDEVSSKKGVKNALWSSAGQTAPSLPWGEAEPAVVVVVRGKVSAWRGIKKALWDSAGHLSIRERWGWRWGGGVPGEGGERVARGEVGVGLKLENGHSSPLMVTTAPWH